MRLGRFAFIVKAHGYAPAVHRAVLDCGEFRTWIVGVSSRDEALAVLEELVALDVQLVELCGGFSRNDAEECERRIGGRIPVGVVTYSEAQEARLSELFS